MLNIIDWLLQILGMILPFLKRKPKLIANFSLSTTTALWQRDRQESGIIHFNVELINKGKSVTNNYTLRFSLPQKIIARATGFIDINMRKNNDFILDGLTYDTLIFNNDTPIFPGDRNIFTVTDGNKYYIWINLKKNDLKQIENSKVIWETQTEDCSIQKGKLNILSLLKELKGFYN